MNTSNPVDERLAEPVSYSLVGAMSVGKAAEVGLEETFPRNMEE